MPGARLFVVIFLAVLWILSGSAAQTAPATGTEEESEATREISEETIAELRAQVEQLSELVVELQKKLEELKTQQDEAARKAQVERIRSAARERLAESGEPESTVDVGTAFVSGTRMQSQLNPELSVTGDLWLVGGDSVREQLQAQHFELDIQSYLDPFSRMHLVVGVGEHGHGLHGDHEHGGEGEGEEHDHHEVEVEEGYITWLNLPGNTTLSVGRKRQQFGVLNRWHAHALDQADMPWVLEESFGDHGLTGTGISLDWLLPKMWAHVNELTFEVTNGDNDAAFAGGSWEHPTFLVRLKNYWDLSADSYLELGLNGLHGSADPDGHLDHDLYALDLTFNWYPTGRELYREFTLRGMLLRSERDLAPDLAHTTWGGYLYAQSKVSRSWIVGLRYDWVEDRVEADDHFWGVSPYLTLWQSEFVRLRAQASYREDNHHGGDWAYLIQTTLSAGPHKHEMY